MQLNIKQLILEGYSYEEITEAVHANHPNLNKKGTERSLIGKLNRQELADDLRKTLRDRNQYRRLQNKETSPEERERYKKEANYYDNLARARSQTGRVRGYLSFAEEAKQKQTLSQKRLKRKPTDTERQEEHQALIKRVEERPRIISSAKQ